MDNNERPLTAEEKAARREELHQRLDEMYIKRHGHPRPEPQIKRVTEHVTDDGRPFKYVAYDNDIGEFYDTPPSEEEKQARIDELCIKMDWLATEVFWGFEKENIDEIRNVFTEYFKLTSDDDVISKRVMGDLMLIVDMYHRALNNSEIEVPNQRNSYDMYTSLIGPLENWGSDAVDDWLRGKICIEGEFEEDEPYFRQKYEKFKADYKARQEKREWVRNLKPTE